MRNHRLSKTALRCLSAALVLTLLVVAAGVPPAAAQELSDYFEFEFDPVEFVDQNDNPKTDIDGYETFYARLWGRVDCLTDLPEELNGFKTEDLRRLRLRLRVTAEHVGGGDVTLNTRYTITKPLPIKEGDSVEIDERIPLKFPGGSESGAYDVSMTLTELAVEVKFMGFWIWYEVTDQVPTEYRTWPTGEQLTYTAPPNTPPRDPDLPSPEHGATDVSPPVTLSVRVRDIDNDPMTVTFFDASDDSVIGTVSGVASGSRAEVTWPGRDAGVTHNWYVTAHDGKAATQGPAWSFTTASEDNDAEPPPTPVLTSIAPAPDAVSLIVGETEQLTVIANYDDETTADVTNASDYASDNEDVATVSATGLITAVGEGEATITVTYTEEGVTRTAEVSVEVTEEDDPVNDFVDNPPIEEGLASIADELLIVYIWRPATQSWDMYWPQAGIDTIGTLEAGLGYWILVDSACTLEYGTRSWELFAGWNNTAWLPQ